MHSWRKNESQDTPWLNKKKLLYYRYLVTIYTWGLQPSFQEDEKDKVLWRQGGAFSSIFFIFILIHLEIGVINFIFGIFSLWPLMVRIVARLLSYWYKHQFGLDMRRQDPRKYVVSKLNIPFSASWDGHYQIELEEELRSKLCSREMRWQRHSLQTADKRVPCHFLSRGDEMS